MKIAKTSLIVGLIGIATLSGTVLAQELPPPGGGETPKDSLPWQPYNWEITKTRSGTDTISSWTMKNGLPFNQVDTFTWASLIQSMGATNDTGTPRTGYMTSEGTVTLKIKWVGVGPAPTKVLVTVLGFVNGGTNPVGTVEVDNGLGSEVVTDSTLLFSLYKYQRPALRYIDINGTGEGQLELSKRAYAQVASAGNFLAYAIAKNDDLSVSGRALTVSGDPSPTYYAGYHDMPFPNKTDNPKKLTMDIGVTKVDGLWQGSAYMNGALWGPWNLPAGAWQWNDLLTPNWLNGRYRQSFTNEEVVGLMHSPITTTNSLSVTDSDGVSDTVNVTLRIHSPTESPAVTSEGRQYSKWKRVSPYYYGTGGSLVLSQAYSKSEAVTKGITIGAKGTVSGLTWLPGDHPLALELNASVQYAETATVTTMMTAAMGVADGGDPDLKYCLIKRVFWQQKKGFCLGYGSNGYIGLQDFAYTYWTSGTKSQAEANDHEYQVASVDKDFDGEPPE